MKKSRYITGSGINTIALFIPGLNLSFEYYYDYYCTLAGRHQVNHSMQQNEKQSVESQRKSNTEKKTLNNIVVVVVVIIVIISVSLNYRFLVNKSRL